MTWRLFSTSALFSVLSAFMFTSISSPVLAQTVSLQGIVVEAASPVGSSERPGENSLPGQTILGASSLSLEQSFASVTLVTEDQIQRQYTRTIGDALANKPGITSSNFAAGASRPIIRGLDNFRIRIQENGIGVHDVSALSEDHGVPIDPLALSKIEVIRGPATLRWGSQAIGGVVNATNSRIINYIPKGGFSRIEKKGAYSSVDNGHEGAIIVEGGKDNIALHVDLYKRKGEDYDTPQGKQEGTRFDSHGGAFGASIVGEKGYFGFSFAHFASLYFIPGEEATERGLRIDMEQNKFSSKGAYYHDGAFVKTIKYWLGYTDYTHDEIEQENGEKEIGSTFNNKQFEARTEILHTPQGTSLGQMSGALGLQYGHQDLSAKGEGGELIAPSERQTIAGYIFEEFETTNRLKLQFAGRIEQVTVDGSAGDFPAQFLPPFMGFEVDETNRSRKFLPLSSSAGMIYKLTPQLAFRLTGQYVERAPEALELFAKGPHEATETFEIGNPNLSKEKAQTVEIGLKKNKGRLRFDSSAYYTQYQGFIYKDFTGNSCGDEFDSCVVGDGEELTQIAYRQRDAEFYGFEISAEFDLIKMAYGTLGIDGQYDIVRAKFANGENIPRIPPHRIGSGVFYRQKNVFARVGFLHAFAQKDTAVGETQTSGYTLLNAEINTKFKLPRMNGVSPVLTLGLKGENLLDDDVRNHVSFKKEDVLQPGRNIMIHGKLNLN